LAAFSTLFGRIFTIYEIAEAAQRSGLSAYELRQHIAEIEFNYQNGYVYGRAFSAATPKGFLVSEHKARMWPISSIQFAEAEKHRFRVGEMPGFRSWLTDIFVEYARWAHPWQIFV